MPHSVAGQGSAKADRILASIHRDRFGFPHIIGRSDEAVLFAHAVAQLDDAPFSVLASLARATGRLAETLGRASPAGPLSQDPHVVADLQACLFRHAAHGRRLLAAMPRRLRGWMSAFTAGLRAVPALDREGLVRRLIAGPPGLDPPAAKALAGMSIRAEHIAALDHYIAARPEIERLTRRPSAPTSSNAIAVSAEASRSGHALLLVDPHIPFDASPELRLLMTHLRGPTIDAAGMTRPASLLPALGWFSGIALAVTSNWPATAWRVRCERRGERVWLFGRWRRLMTRRVRVVVLGGRVLERRVHHVGREMAPVLRLTGRHAWVGFMATARGGALTEQVERLMSTRPARRALLRSLQVPGHPSLNFLVARSDGGVAYRWNARVPREVEDPRSPFDARVEIDASEIRRPPIGWWPASRLPAAGGRVLVNNNASFDRVTGSPDGSFERFPEAVQGVGLSLGSFRHTQALSWLKARGRRPIGLGSLERLALDDHHPRGRALIEIVAGRPGRRSRPVAAALVSLARWNGRASPASRACTLIELALLRFRECLGEELFGLFDRPELVGMFSDRERTVLCRCLGEAYRLWVARDRPRWRDVHGLLLPGRGAPTWLGVSGTGHTLRAAEPLVAPSFPGTGTHAALPRIVVGHGQSTVLVVQMSRIPRIRFLKVLANREDVPDENLTRAWAGGRFQDFEMDARRVARRRPETLIRGVGGRLRVERVRRTPVG